MTISDSGNCYFTTKPSRTLVQLSNLDLTWVSRSEQLEPKQAWIFLQIWKRNQEARPPNLFHNCASCNLGIRKLEVSKRGRSWALREPTRSPRRFSLKRFLRSGQDDEDDDRGEPLTRLPPIGYFSRIHSTRPYMTRVAKEYLSF